MPGRTMIFGSGGKDADAIEGVVKDPKQTAGENAMMDFKQLASNPLTLPLAPLAFLASVLQQGAAGLGGPMAARRFTDFGEVVPTTTSKELYRRNIFGEG